MELLKKEYAGLPLWAWLAIAGAGVGIGWLILKSTQSANTSTSNAVGQTIPTQQSVLQDQPSPTQGAFPETQVGSDGQIPVVPGGYVPQYDASGNLIAFQGPSQPTTSQTPPVPAPVTPGMPPVPTQPVPPPVNTPPAPNGPPSGTDMLSAIMTKAGAIEILPRQPYFDAHGKVIHVPVGTKVELVNTQPIPDPGHTPKSYYLVTWQKPDGSALTGYVGSDVIELGKGGGGEARHATRNSVFQQTIGGGLK